MKRIFFTLAQLCLLITVSAKTVRAQNHVQTITVTNGMTTITADGNYNQVLLRENSASPSAAFSITLAGTSTALNYPAGTQFLFSGNFVNGQAIGTIQATTAGPFSFVAVESNGPPSQSVKNTILSGGSSGNATSIQGLSVSSTAPSGVQCLQSNSGDTQLLFGSCSGAAGVTNFSAGALPPLFTTSVATSTTTPALTFSLSTAAANSVFGNCTATNPAAPSYCSITGAMLPVPSASTLGGVESITVVSHNFLTGISTSGVPSQAQPAFTDISGTLVIAQGGTGATSAANALINLLPVASEAGDLIYCSSFSSGCTAWSILPGNNSGTKVLQETSSGIPSWVANGGGVTSFSGDGVILTNSASTGAVTTTISGTSGGIVYFSSSSAWASSALLTHYGLIYGGGSAGSPVSLGAATNGQLPIGSTGGAPVLGNITSTGGITVTNGAGTIALVDQFKVESFQRGGSCANQTVTNTTTKTTMCSFTLPANELGSSQVLVIDAYGTYATAASSPGNFTIETDFGSTTGCTTAATALATSVATRGWRWHCEIMPTAAPGASVVSQEQGSLNWNTSSATVSTVIDASNSSTINLATSSSQTIALAVTFQTASASNSFTVNIFKAVRQN